MVMSEEYDMYENLLDIGDQMNQLTTLIKTTAEKHMNITEFTGCYSSVNEVEFEFSSKRKTKALEKLIYNFNMNPNEVAKDVPKVIKFSEEIRNILKKDFSKRAIELYDASMKDIFEKIVIQRDNTINVDCSLSAQYQRVYNNKEWKYLTDSDIHDMLDVAYKVITAIDKDFETAELLLRYVHSVEIESRARTGWWFDLDDHLNKYNNWTDLKTEYNNSVLFVPVFNILKKEKSKLPIWFVERFLEVAKNNENPQEVINIIRHISMNNKNRTLTFRNKETVSSFANSFEIDEMIDILESDAGLAEKFIANANGHYQYRLQQYFEKNPDEKLRFIEICSKTINRIMRKSDSYNKFKKLYKNLLFFANDEPDLSLFSEQCQPFILKYNIEGT